MTIPASRFERNKEEPIKPVFNKEYCDENDIRSKWFKFDDELATYLLLMVEPKIYPEDHKNAGEWYLDGAYAVGLVITAIIQYKQNGYIEYPELEKILEDRGDLKVARAAYKKAVENIEQSRIDCAKKVWNGTHAHDKSSN